MRYEISLAKFAVKSDLIAVSSLVTWFAFVLWLPSGGPPADVHINRPLKRPNELGSFAKRDQAEFPFRYKTNSNFIFYLISFQQPLSISAAEYAHEFRIDSNAQMPSLELLSQNCSSCPEYVAHTLTVYTYARVLRSIIQTADGILEPIGS